MLLIYTEIISKLLTLASPQAVIAEKRIRHLLRLTGLVSKSRFVSTGHLGMAVECAVGLEIRLPESVLAVTQINLRIVVVIGLATSLSFIFYYNLLTLNLN